MAALVRHLNRRRPLRLALIAPAVLLALLASPRSATRASLNRWTVRTALRGISLRQYHLAVEEVAEQLASAQDNFADAARDAIDDAHAVGPVWVVTASERSLAAAYLRQIGYGDLRVLASQLGCSDDSLRITHHNVGHAKVAALRSAEVDLTESLFYTDSASDEKLARACRRTIIVNGSRRTRRILAKSGTAVRSTTW